MKYSIGFLLLICILLSGISCSYVKDVVSQQDIQSVVSDFTSKTEQVSVSGATDAIVVYFVDVGQGDCIVVTCNGKNMIIDAGSGSNTKDVTSFINKVGITHFDIIVLTHPDEDHIGNLDMVVSNWADSNTVVYAPKLVKTTLAFENFIKAIKGKGLALNAPVSGESFTLGSATCKILAPNKATYDATNNYSIVLRIFNANGSFLLTGDAEVESENEITAKYTITSDVLKVGHHGSTSSTSDKFYSAVSPKYCVISVGEGNKYGHPAASILSRISYSTIYRTDKDGTVVFTQTKDGKLDIKTNY